jgi:glycosyltransferase involved in cell wall biosynthesis
VLVISSDAVGVAMAGVGIRAYEIARALQPHAEVTLAAVESELEPLRDVEYVPFRHQRPTALAPLIAAADAVFCQPQWPVIAGMLRRSDARLIYDLYDPETFETLEHFATARRPWRRLMTALSVDRLADALRTGDHFVCASEKQRDLWIGAMLAERLIDPARYDADPSLRSLIDLVPFGVPADPPLASGGGPRERFPAIGAQDEIVLWNGGIWGWLDAPTAIRAIARVRERRPGARLVFMGAATAGPAKEPTAEAKSLAAELGLLDDGIHFNDEWVPYERRADWLLDSDCAVSTHSDHLETRYAFRTRLLDCFWAGLPIACTSGDDLAALVESAGLGATSPPGDPAALAAAIEEVLERGRPAYADALARAAATYAWPSVIRPLAGFIASAVPLRRRSGSGPARRPAHRLRAGAYVGARRALNAVGLRRWPRA